MEYNIAAVRGVVRMALVQPRADATSPAALQPRDTRGSNIFYPR